MAKEFVMGAKMTLQDAFSSPLRFIMSNVSRARMATAEYARANDSARDSLSRFTAGAKSTTGAFRGIATAAEGAKGKIVSLQGAITAVVAGATVKKGFDWLVSGNADMEQYQNTLGVVLKDQTKAAETLKWAQTFAAQTPFEIPQVVEATTKLASYGLEAQKTLGVTGDMAAVMGKSLDQAVEAVADAQTGEVERLKEFGITKDMIAAQAKTMGTVVMDKKGAITDQKAFNAALFSLMEQRYKGGMALQATTFRGMLSNASDFIGTMGRELGKPLFEKLKQGLGQAMEWFNRFRDSGQLADWTARVQNELAYAWGLFVKFGGIVWQVAQGIGSALQTAGGWVTWIFNEIQAQAGGQAAGVINAVGQGLVQAFHDFENAAKPVVAWLVDVGLPKLQDGLVWAGTKAIETANYIKDNWSTIKPLFEGIAIAWGGYLLVVKGMAAALAIETAAQWLLNAAMNANPIGLVITAIGLLIGAGILLYQNWDTVKQKANDLWVNISNFFRSGVNKAIDEVNRLIDIVNRIPGIHIGGVDRVQMLEEHAGAAAGHATGLANVPFDGYRAELHQGERVLTAAQNRRYDTALGFQQSAPAANTATQYNIAKLVDKVEIYAAPGDDGETLYEKFITVFHRRAKEAAGILSTAEMGDLL